MFTLVFFVFSWHGSLLPPVEIAQAGNEQPAVTKREMCSASRVHTPQAAVVNASTISHAFLGHPVAFAFVLKLPRFIYSLVQPFS